MRSSSCVLALTACLSLVAVGPNEALGDLIGDEVFGCFAFVGGDCDSGPPPFFGNLFENDTAVVTRDGELDGGEFNAPGEFFGQFSLLGADFNINVDITSEPDNSALVRFRVERSDTDVLLDPFFLLFDDLDWTDASSRIFAVDASSHSSEFRIDRIVFDDDGVLVEVSEPFGDELGPGSLLDIQIETQHEVSPD